MTEVLTVAEVAKRLRIGRDAAYMLVRSGRLPSIRIGRRYLIAESQLVQFIHTPANWGDGATISQ